MTNRWCELPKIKPKVLKVTVMGVEQTSFSTSFDYQTPPSSQRNRRKHQGNSTGTVAFESKAGIFSSTRGAPKSIWKRVATDGVVAGVWFFKTDTRETAQKAIKEIAEKKRSTARGWKRSESAGVLRRGKTSGKSWQKENGKSLSGRCWKTEIYGKNNSVGSARAAALEESKNGKLFEFQAVSGRFHVYYEKLGLFTTGRTSPETRADHWPTDLLLFK